MATLDPDPIKPEQKGRNLFENTKNNFLQGELYLFKILSVLPLVSRLLLVKELEWAECLVFVLKILQLRAANRCSHPTPRAEQVPPEYKAVLRIHDILVWIRIRIRGYMPLTNGSGSGFGSGPWIGSCFFRHWPTKCQQKRFFSYYFCMMTEGIGSIPLTHGFGSGSRRHKNIRIRRIRIRNTDTSKGYFNNYTDTTKGYFNNFFFMSSIRILKRQLSSLL